MAVLIHLDTDLGGDLDDLCALALLLTWPGVTLSGVTTVADDGGRRAGYARFVLDLAGRQNVPVAAGADAAAGRFRTWPGLPPEARYWPRPVPPLPGPEEGALDLLANGIRAGATVVGIGPWTNLSLLEGRQPGLLGRAPLVLMGGALRAPPAGLPAFGSRDDYNVQVDVPAAAHVLAVARPVLVPIEVTAQTALRRAQLPALRGAGPLGALLAHQAEAFAADEGHEARYGRAYAGLPDDTINFQHDPLACAVALGWPGAQIETLPLAPEVREGWLILREGAGGRPTRIATAVDGAAFGDLWLETVLAGAPGRAPDGPGTGGGPAP